MFKNYYQLLGIKENATPLEVKEAYRKLSKKIHPDLNQGETFFLEYFKEVQEAYAVLSDQEKKRSYDLSRFKPLENRVTVPSNIKHMDYQISRLELKVRDQDEVILALEDEKKSLNQEMEYFVKALFEVKNERTTLQKKVKELEQETRNLSKSQAQGNEAAELAQKRELQKKLQAQESEHLKKTLSLEQDLKKAQQAVAAKTGELTEVSGLKKALEKRVQELAMQLSQLQVKQQGQQKTQVQESENQKKNQQELARHAEENKKLEKQLQELEKGHTIALTQQKQELEKDLGESRQQLEKLVQALTQESTQQKKQVETLEQQKTQIEAVLQRKAKELELALLQKNNLAQQLDELEKVKAIVSTPDVTPVKGDYKIKQTQKQLQEATQQAQTLQRKVQELELAAKQLNQEVAEKTTEIQREVQAKKELQTSVQALERKITQLEEALQRKTEELAQEVKQRQTLQANSQELELKTKDQLTELQAKAEKLAQITQLAQEANSQVQKLTQQETSLRASLKELELKGSQQQATLVASITSTLR